MGDTENPWRSPLVPVALAATAGIVADRWASLPLLPSLLAAVAGIVSWALTPRSRAMLATAYLWGSVAALGAAYHHVHRDLYADDDIGNLATADPRPAHLRGILAEEPSSPARSGENALRSMAAADATVAVLRVTACQTGDDWLPVSGRARLVVAGQLTGLHVGDEVEAVGRLVAPHGPANPGEVDQAAALRDQRIRALFIVQKTGDAVERRSEAWSATPASWLASVRGWCHRRLVAALPPQESGIATALLLGEGNSLAPAFWDRYKRSGVLHVLIIAGQHLVLLALFLWAILRFCSVRQRRGAVIVAVVLLGYAFLTGGRPPAMRAAATVSLVCLGLVLGRPSLRANALALAWLTVAALNPDDLFAPGCQLSFLAVIVLYWGAARWWDRPIDPVQRLIDEARPAWLRSLRNVGVMIGRAYVISAIIWLASAPLVAANYHTVAPIGVLLCPPLMLVMAIALAAGFVLLLAELVCWPLVPVCAAVARWCLSLCDGIVTLSDGLPGGHWYVPEVPAWWLWGFYSALLAVLLIRPLQSRRAVLAGLAWLVVGLLPASVRPGADEFRCTFLAVGHGGCTVLETEDGRVLLYDAGALGGPEVTTRVIAPYLWARGIRRIDEVFLSHADLDHFNGLPELLDRFAVGLVTCTPTFADRSTPAVGLTLETLKRHAIPMRIVRAGDRLTAGPLTLDVLHPPANGPEGKENYRSLVLLVRHGEDTILLTGDLEGPGMERVLEMPGPKVDVLMAPHHGSRAANTSVLAEWARPSLVISCEGPPRGALRPTEPYTSAGIPFLGTWPHGAITVHSGPQGLTVETFATHQQFRCK
jgi:competence protein ComEC